jgi:hypothetical protein
MSTPDALILPESLKKGETQIDRIDSILSIAEPLLKIDRTKGQRAYIRRQPGSRLFVTSNPEDTLQYPVGHDQEGKPRYVWIVQPSGIDYGFLIEGASHVSA